MRSTLRTAVAWIPELKVSLIHVTIFSGRATLEKLKSTFPINNMHSTNKTASRINQPKKFTLSILSSFLFFISGYLKPKVLKVIPLYCHDKKLSVAPRRRETYKILKMKRCAVLCQDVWSWQSLEKSLNSSSNSVVVVSQSALAGERERETGLGTGTSQQWHAKDLKNTFKPLSLSSLSLSPQFKWPYLAISTHSCHVCRHWPTSWYLSSHTGNT